MSEGLSSVAIFIPAEGRPLQPEHALGSGRVVHFIFFWIESWCRLGSSTG